MITVTVQEMKRIEELAKEYFGVDEIQLMENAGRQVARMAREMAGNRKAITILCGKGNNGGDGLVASRFLSNWGNNVNIITPFHPEEMKKLTKDHYGTATSMHLNRMTGVDNLKWELAIRQSDLLIDGLIGYGLKGDPEGQLGGLIKLANNSGKKILSIDCPSGLDCDTGTAMNPCIRADRTITLGIVKKGLLKNKTHAGRLYLADIGIPKEVFELAGMRPPDFQKEDVVKV